MPMKMRLQLRCLGSGFLLLLLCCCRAYGQTPGDERWDVRFGVPGTDNTLLCVATKGDDVYVGGDLSVAGPLNANHVGKWNGVEWSSLGSGIVGPNTFVYALAFKGNDLYAGGTFTNAGGVVAKGIARWDGTNWSTLPGGFSGYALGLAVNGDDLYVAGIFVVGGDTNLYTFAKFDGANWNTFGSTVSGCVGTFCTPVAKPIFFDGSDIYVGGSFTNFAGLSANSIARWDGAHWNALSSGLGGTNVFVGGISKFAGQLVVAGGFTTAGGVQATNVARWDGTSWLPMGNANNTLQQVFSDGLNLYAAG